MPESLHAELAEAAERDGSSLNQFIIGVLASAVDWHGDRDHQRTGNGAAATGSPRAKMRPRWTTPLLVANFIVVTVVALAAIAFLVAALR